MDITISLGSSLGPIFLLGLIALPSLLAVLRQRGWLVGVFALVIVGLLIVTLEAVSIKSGLPYGRFSYDELLGFRLFGTTPWIIALAYAPLILAAFWLASKITTSHGRISLSVFFILLMSAALEPALAALYIRQWQESGPFFGVPLLCFVGWFLTATLASGLLHVLWGEDRIIKRNVAFSGLSLLLFLLGINIGIRRWVPAGIAGVVCITLVIIVGLEKWKLAREPST
jgi:putative membrane protein